MEFDADIGRGKNFFKPRIVVVIPKSVTYQEVRTVVRNTALGLAKLHWEYLICQPTEPQAVPQEERDAAIAELREMGFEIQETSGREKMGGPSLIVGNVPRASKRS